MNRLQIFLLYLHLPSEGLVTNREKCTFPLYKLAILPQERMLTQYFHYTHSVSAFSYLYLAIQNRELNHQSLSALLRDQKTYDGNKHTQIIVFWSLYRTSFNTCPD